MNDTAIQSKNWWSAKEFACDWGVSENTIWRRAREEPDFPKPVKLSPKHSRFRDEDKRAYEERKAVESAGKKRKAHENVG